MIVTYKFREPTPITITLCVLLESKYHKRVVIWVILRVLLLVVFDSRICSILLAVFTKQQLYDHLSPITKTIQVRRTRHAEHCWRSKDKHISNIFLRTPSHGLAKAEGPARTYIQQLCADTGYSFEDLSGAMDDWEMWWHRVREICTGSATWWCSIPGVWDISMRLCM